MSDIVERTRANADAIAATDGKKIGAYQSDLICKETMEIVKNLREAATAIETLTREKSALELELALSKPLYSRRQLEARAEASESALREALDVVRFYSKEWKFKPNKRYGGLEYSPSENLLDDCGNAARAFIEKHAPASEDK